MSKPLTEKPTLGSTYYIIACWTASGGRPEQCIWRDDFVDNDRLKAGMIYTTYKDAKESMED